MMTCELMFNYSKNHVYLNAGAVRDIRLDILTSLWNGRF
jgi:hypothetical protein